MAIQDKRIAETANNLLNHLDSCATSILFSYDRVITLIFQFSLQHSDMSWFTPTTTQLSEQQRNNGLKYMFHDGLCSHAMTLLVTGSFLPGIALALGASNFVIGILASLAPMSQMAQIPAILLVEYVGLRKLITVIAALISRIALLFVGIIPFYIPQDLQIAVFMLLMVIFFACGAVGGCSWSSWIKDIVPEKTIGTYLAKRLAAATALGAALTIIAGFCVDSLTVLFGEPARAYAVIFYIAALFGIAGVKALSKVAEPQMPNRNPDTSWISSLLEPVKDPNFRRLIMFSFSWSFTVIMSGAFFAVYMLQRIGLSMTVVITLAVLSQITNIYFFKVWGNIADRYSNKSVLNVSLPLFILILLLYPFTTLPGPHTFTLPLLIVIHIIGGISTAGFNLCAANIALRLAPHHKATAYLGANSFISGLAATIAPILGGLIGAVFVTHEISLKIFYTANIDLPGGGISIPAMSFRGLDFVFIFAAFIGFYAIHRLSLVEEEGTVSESEVRDQVFTSVRQSLVNTSSFSIGIRRMTAFPYDLLRKKTRSTYGRLTSISRRKKAVRTTENKDNME